MKSRTTGIWFIVAAILFATLWLCQRFLHPAAPTSLKLLPGLHAADVTGIEIAPSGATTIDADRKNGVWQLDKPLTYPAQATPIETLLDALEKQTAIKLSGGGKKNTEANFGFDKPQFSIVIRADNQQWQLRVGNKTAPGDQVFLRVAGKNGVYITDTDWLKFLPPDATVWRDTSLVDANSSFDAIRIVSGAKSIELHIDPTNHLWRMTYPLAARADNLRIVEALQQLRTAHIEHFVTDDPKADLATFGLQPADLDLWLGNGTNFTVGIHAGKTATNDASQIFVRRDGWNTVATIAASALSEWQGSVNDFRDHHLVNLTAPVAEIQVQGGDTNDDFTLRSTSSNTWKVVGETFPVDTNNVQNFIRQLANLRIAEFRKDKNTPTDLQNFGLTAPSRQITLRSGTDDTNNVIAQLLFSTIDTNKVYVKRADENFVYTITKADFDRLPETGWQFRERRIWDFSETNVAQVTLHQNGMTRVLQRTGLASWSIVSGSGIINALAVEEAVHRLGQLSALAWFRRNNPTPANDGFNTNNLQIVTELKSGKKFTLDFGAESSKLGTAVAAVTLDGERWELVLPPSIYLLVAENLTIPPPAK